MTVDAKRKKASRDIVQQLKRLAVALQGAAAPEWLGLDLTMGQLKGLFALARCGAATIGRLAEMLGVGEPAASLLVDRLVRQGHVVRSEDPEDRRRTIASLSKAGLELVANIRHGGKESLDRWLAALDEGDLEALRRGLRALVAAAEDDARGPAASDRDRRENLGFHDS